MARLKKEVVEVSEEEMDTPAIEHNSIFPIEVTFANGDDNLLKEKINELVRQANK